MPLLKFMLPVLAALFLQSLYGAVDLLVVGKFAESTDVSAVSTGSQLMLSLTSLISSFAMGMTVYLGQKIGEGKGKKGGEIVGTGIFLFLLIGIILTLCIPAFAAKLAELMHAPAEAFDQTVSYVRICGMGIIIIIAYNLIGSIFRGIGDSRTPLITVLIACICNIFGDVLLVAGFHMGTTGAAIATVFAQGISVVISFILIRRQSLPFTFSVKQIRPVGEILRRMIFLGAPIALQDLLVSISFLVILAIVNALGLTISAGVGVAEKVCGFIMLVPSAFAQSMSAFVAQNIGAGRYDRAKMALFYGIGASAVISVLMFYIAFFHGDLLAEIFSNDGAVVLAAADFLKAYAIDCLLTCFLFCFVGFFNGNGLTTFVMAQGIVGAFCVRVPVSFLMSRQEPVSLFHIGLATPCSTVVQIVMCVICMMFLNRRVSRQQKQ